MAVGGSADVAGLPGGVGEVGQRVGAALGVGARVVRVGVADAVGGGVE
jgi:hypothetical protein